MSYDIERPLRDSEIPIACNLSDAEQAKRGEEVVNMFSHADQVNELIDGYAFRFPGSTQWAVKLMDFIMVERSCCPFFTFELVFEVGEGPIWLHLRGPEDVRDFIKSEFIVPHDMISTPNKPLGNVKG